MRSYYKSSVRQLVPPNTYFEVDKCHTSSATNSCAVVLQFMSCAQDGQQTSCNITDRQTRPRSKEGEPSPIVRLISSNPIALRPCAPTLVVKRTAGPPPPSALGGGLAFWVYLNTSKYLRHMIVQAIMFNFYICYITIFAISLFKLDGGPDAVAVRRMRAATESRAASSRVPEGRRPDGGLLLVLVLWLLWLLSLLLLVVVVVVVVVVVFSLFSLGGGGRDLRRWAAGAAGRGHLAAGAHVAAAYYCLFCTM